MKIRIQIIALLANLLLASAVLAAPELSVHQGNFNFGTVTQGKKVQHNFVVVNSGDAPLQIRQLSASCGCTAAKPSASVVPPGKSAEIQVVFDSTNFTGAVEKTVAMTTNAGKTPSYTLRLEGNIIEPLQVIPRQLNLGPLKPGVAKQGSLAVTNMGSGNVKLVAVNVTSTAFQVKSTIRKGELKPGETGTIELQVTPRPEAKVLSGYLHIVTTSPQKKEITVSIFGTQAK